MSYSRTTLLPRFLTILILGLALGGALACGPAPTGLKDMARPFLTIMKSALPWEEPLTLSIENSVQVRDNDPCVALPNGVTATQDGAPMGELGKGYRVNYPPGCYYPLFQSQFPPSSEATTTFVVSDGVTSWTVSCDNLGTPTTATFLEPADGVLHPGQQVTLQVTPRAWNRPSIEVDVSTTDTTPVARIDEVTMGDGTASFTVPTVPAGNYQLRFEDEDDVVCRPSAGVHVVAPLSIDFFLPATVTTP